MSKLTKIKDVSTRYEITTGTLRYYEKMGLIESNRDESSGYRLYDEKALNRLRQILILRKMNISIGDIGRIFAANNSDALLSVLDKKVDDIDSEVAVLHDLKEIVLEFIRQLRQVDFHNEADVKMLFDKAVEIETSLISDSVDLVKFFDTSDQLDERLISIAVGDKKKHKKEDIPIIKENFEVVKCGPYRFIGRSIYARAWGGPVWGPRDHIEFLWKQSASIFKMLDEMNEYASDDPHNAGLRHWEWYNDENGRESNNLKFGKTELLGYTVGRFMKPETPVPEGMNYIDIPEMHVGKTWIKVKPGEKGRIDEGPVYDEINGTGIYRAAAWIFAAEVYPAPDENGDITFKSYVACEKLPEKEM